MMSNRTQTFTNAIRVIVAVVLIFNALIPIVASASSTSSQQQEQHVPEVNEANSIIQWLQHTKPFWSGFRIDALAQEIIAPTVDTAIPPTASSGTPLPTTDSTMLAPTTPLTTISPAGTVNPTPPPSATEPPANTQTAIPTIVPTLTPTTLPTSSPTPVFTSPTPMLSFNLSVSPQQAAPGDTVIFTVQITNNGNTDATGLRYLDTLPQAFGSGQDGFKGFSFDPQTHMLSWSGDAINSTTLSAGQTITLQYSVRLDPHINDEVKIIDSALLLADGLTTPLAAQAPLTVLSAGKQLSAVDTKGGIAQGLAGHVRLNFLAGDLAAPQAIMIQDLGSDYQTPNQKPWLTFQLESRSPQIQTSDPEPYEQDSIVSFQPEQAKFAKPVELTISFQGIVDLAKLPADQAPYLATLDPNSNTWTRVLIQSVDRETDTITAYITHFSTWGAGIGAATPQDNANILLFDHPYPDSFTGRAHFSLPIWTPSGRNGMAPSLVLTYSSNLVNGILGDVQAPWAGIGWNVDTMEIARQITDGNCNPCGNGSYGYVNNFILLLNGIGYELIPDGTTPGRYHTQSESFLYIQLHNDALGNNSPTAQNTGGEWWEVVQRDGTRWRLGWTADSEQLAAMAGYPGTNSGTWASLGYAGHASDVVAFRWRANLATDLHGNTMTFSYFEESRQVAGSTAIYDRASYIDTISYTGGALTPGYSVHFMRQSRTAEIPSSPADWDNWDTYLLHEIDIDYGSTIMRSYSLGYQVNTYTDSSLTWQTTVLTSVAISGGGTSLPTMNFSYVDEANRAGCGTGCPVWAYPRLSSINNGWGATSGYTYANDGRTGTSWYDWSVSNLSLSDGVNPSPMTTSYSYSTPCYNDPIAGWCNSSNVGELVGYGQSISSTKDFDGATNLAIKVEKFFTDQQRAGRAHEIDHEDGSGNILSRTNIAYTVVTTGMPAGGYFTYPSQVQQFLESTMVSQTAYTYDTTNGNLTLEQDYDGTPTLYRQTQYQYVTNTSPSVWILNKVSQQSLDDATGATISEQQYGYDGNLPGSGILTLGELTLQRAVTGSQTIDTGYVYDQFGNVTESHGYKSYGTVGSQPTGAYRLTSIGYDTNLETYVTATTNPLNQTTQIAYDFGLGVPTTVTDPNNNSAVAGYDGLARPTSITYPGYHQANIQYIYPSTSAPTALQVNFLDETTGVYRSSWQISDGIGRVIQTQDPYQTAGSLILKDTSYNAMGLAQDQGLPHTLNLTGGTYSAPNWASIPHTVTGYDGIGRVLNVAYPDGSQESTSYSGLTTTMIDRNSHQTGQLQDAFGRKVQVQEYTGSGPYNLYATTSYQYDVRNLLSQITDAQSHQITIGYDGFGRKISMSDPNMGSWSYTNYDVFGNMGTQTDARTCDTNVTYDDLNRPLQKTYSGPGACASTPSITYTYDSTTANNQGIGHRTGMTDGSGSSSWFYNALGQATNQTRTIDGTNYPMGFTFDAFSRPLTEDLPSGESLNYGYNAMGALSSLSGTSTYVSQMDYSASGQVTDEQLGNGLLQQNCYDTNTLRLTGLRVYSGTLQSCGTQPSNPVLNLSYSYQPNGNLSQTVDGTQNQTINYTYDELDRLLSASGANNKNYAYNASGNIASITTTPTLKAVSAGDLFTCALTANGGVKCWGINVSGQLGDGTTTNRLTPVDVVGLTNGVIVVEAGGGHACALTAAGGVKCWGSNSSGQLGDGTTTNRLAPVDVVGLTSGVVAISAGGIHTCALTISGGVKCWGYNGNGQLGNGTTKDSSTPVDVSGLTSGVATISAGGDHTCAVTTSGGAKCWGKNATGQLGNGSTKDSKTPVDVTGLTSGVATITTGQYFTCTLTNSGGVKCWGSNAYGQLGDGTTNNRLTPVDVTGLTSGAAAITAGFGHTCAMTTSGGAECWGANGNGQLGDGTTTQRLTPVNVSGLASGVATISAGGDVGNGEHTCALTTGGVVKCWGANTYGELGDGTTTGELAPITTNFSLINGYTYNNNQVTSLSTGETYSYDADGNMISRTEGGQTYTQVFDAENHLVSVTVGGQATQFVYDGDGTMVEKINPDGSKVIYVGGVYEVGKNSNGVVTSSITYYPAAGAMRVNGALYYISKDRLNSAVMTTDASGNIIGQMRYYASGQTLLSTGTMITDRLFTGQRQVINLNVYQFGARFYSPNIGRFLSADPFIPQLFNPQSLNRYSYVQNNPLMYIDPSGFVLCSATNADWGPSTWASCGTTTTTTTTTTTASSGGSTSGTSGGGGVGTPAATTANMTYLNSTINNLYGGGMALIFGEGFSEAQQGLLTSLTTKLGLDFNGVTISSMEGPASGYAIGSPGNIAINTGSGSFFDQSNITQLRTLAEEWKHTTQGITEASQEIGDVAENEARGFANGLIDDLGNLDLTPFILILPSKWPGLVPTTTS